MLYDYGSSLNYFSFFSFFLLQQMLLPISLERDASTNSWTIVNDGANYVMKMSTLLYGSLPGWLGILMKGLMTVPYGTFPFHCLSFYASILLCHFTLISRDKFKAGDGPYVKTFTFILRPSVRQNTQSRGIRTQRWPYSPSRKKRRKKNTLSDEKRPDLYNYNSRAGVKKKGPSRWFSIFP